MRQTIYFLAEMSRSVTPRHELEAALLRDCPQEAEFIAMILDELYNDGPTAEDGDEGR